MASRFHTRQNITGPDLPPVSQDLLGKVTHAKDGKPGHLYCAVLSVWSGDHQEYRDSFEGLYWLASDGTLWDADGHEECSPDYDYLVEQVGCVNPSYVFPVEC